MIQQDGSSQFYINIHNDEYRITYVRAIDRAPGANWAGSDVIRIQAYKGSGNCLNPGPEIPINSENDVYEIISAMCHLVDASRHGD